MANLSENHFCKKKKVLTEEFRFKITLSGIKIFHSGVNEIYFLVNYISSLSLNTKFLDTGIEKSRFSKNNL